MGTQIVPGGRCTQLRIPVVVVLDNLRSAYNVGAFFRTADCAGVERLYLVGITSTPPHRGVAKTALGAEESVLWEYCPDPLPLVQRLREAGYQIAVIETSPKAIDLFDWQPRFPVCLVFGNELTGVQPALLEFSDVQVRIPMFGIKSSLNVATAGAIVIYELLRRFLELRRSYPQLGAAARLE